MEELAERNLRVCSFGGFRKRLHISRALGWMGCTRRVPCARDLLVFPRFCLRTDIFIFVLVPLVIWNIDDRIAESFQESGRQGAHAFPHSLRQVSRVYT